MDIATPQFWLITGAVLVLAVLLIVLAVRGWRRRRQARVIDERLDALAAARLHGVVVPDGNGGEIELEHLLLTAAGVFVVDVKRIEGRIFGSDRMDAWTAITAQGRHSFANPQGPLLDRVAAVRRLLHDVPVDGRVLFAGDAQFGEHPPSFVLGFDAFEAWMRAQAADTSPSEPYVVAWQTLLQVSVAAGGARRDR